MAGAAASSSSFSPLILLTVASLLFSFPSITSAACKSQTFKNKIFSLCSDLPTLNTSLHWTYTASNSSLSIAFVATPPSNGWVSWGINPTDKKMIGSQALLAYRESNGSVTVHTYNISSFENIVPSRIAYEVSQMEAEYSGGVITIFATLSLPKGGPTTVNHVWQVGPGMRGTSPLKHAMEKENLNSTDSLDLSNGGSSGEGNGTSSSGGGNSTSPGSTPSTAVGAQFSSPFLIALAAMFVLLVVA